MTNIGSIWDPSDNASLPPISVVNTSSAPYQILPLQTRMNFNNTGASERAYFQLPNDDGKNGTLVYTFAVSNVNGIRVLCPNGHTIRINGTISVSSGYLQSSAIGSVINIYLTETTSWYARSTIGTWAVT